MANDYDQSLGAQHICANLASYEAARSGFFTFIVDDIDNIIRADYAGDPTEAGPNDRIAHAQEYLKLNVISFPVPHNSLEVLQYRRGNEQCKFAGVPTYEAGQLVVDDVVGLDTKSILLAWKELAYNSHTRKGGRMANYKKTCTLCEYTQDYELIRTWTLYGCWISELSEDAFNKESDGKRQITATIQYDRAEFELPKSVNINA
jgi:hypothetical protein